MTLVRICLAFVCSIFILFTNGQRPYFQQQVDYRIDARLDDSLHQIDATARIHYRNLSPDTLHYIWFHLWPNAYKSERTALGEQLIENGDTRFYFSDPAQKGYINRMDFSVDGIPARTEDHPEHLDILKLILPQPLLPGNSVQILTPFHIQLPEIFSRSGHSSTGTYQVTQWYPKPAVYDREGWHPMHYLDQGEFYSEFGNYDLHYTVPGDYAVASTGSLQDTLEINWLKNRMSANRSNQKENSPQKTIHFRADSVHDVAWFASKRFLVDTDTIQLADGVTRNIWHFYQPERAKVWKHSLEYSKQGLRYYSSRIGAYPYSTISVVESAEGPGGGMEYPMLSVIDPTSDTSNLRSVIIHEIGHNWFYGALASNERDHPWLDEGLNSYYERTSLGSLLEPIETVLLRHLYQERKDQPISTPSDRFTPLNYAAIAYLKTAQWMELLEKSLGREKFDQAMQDYFQQWKFKHPAPSDLLNSFQSHSQADLTHYFNLLDKTGPLKPAPARGWSWKLQTITSWKTNEPYPLKNRISFLPIAGHNQADGLMAGLAVTNLKLPLNDLQWLAIPLYATRSKQINGIGFINHRWRPQGAFKRIDLGVSLAQFSFNRFTAPNGQTLTLRYQKLAPGIRFTWREREARSTQHRFVQFTAFSFQESAYKFQRDTLVQGIDTTFNNYYKTLSEKRSLYQLKYVWENNRVLYPFRWEAKVEMNGQIIRPTLAGHYFFNYPKKGGLHVRVFGGAFMYTGAKTLQERYRQSRYYLQMGSPTGMEDYTYSNYFLGRSAYEGFKSQQIMERDGAFKIRTDRLASPIGRSDDWLFALNLSSSIPDKLNPLQVLPVRIPIHVFADIGTSGATWNSSNESGRWLYVAGLEVPIFYRTIRVFIPLVYSKPYQDYVKSILGPKNRFLQKISFQIDLQSLNRNRINRELELW